MPDRLPLEIHHLLPEDLPEGRMAALVIAQVEGSNSDVFAQTIEIEQHDGVFTMVG